VGFQNISQPSRGKGSGRDLFVVRSFLLFL
jgi:hypothetical protein